VAVLALSAGLVCRSQRRPLPMRVLAGVAIAIGTVKFVQFLNGIPFGVDQILFGDQLGRVAGAAPNRMAPNTAFALAVLGCGLMWSSSRNARTIMLSQILSVASAAIAAVAVVGYALDVVALYRLHNYIAMALPTATVLIALSLAVFSISPHVALGRIIADRGPAGLLARTALPFAVTVPLVVGMLALAGQRAGIYNADAASALGLMSNVLVNFLLLGGCSVALFASDEERKHREAALKQSESQYREAERVGHVGYWRADLATQAVRWSDGFLSISGLPAQAVPSVDAVIGIFHPDDAPLARDFITRADCGNWQFQCRVVRPDGEIRHVRSHGVCVSALDGTPAAILGVLCDITELELARQAAETAKVATASFLANMSHEIRTPMNGVMGFVELLLRGDLEDTQRRHLTLIQDSAQALLKLLNDILDIAKVEAGRLEIAPTPYEIRHGLAQCVRLMSPMAEQKGLALSLDFADDVPPRLLIDGLRVRQIVLNLVGNAVKFTDHGSVEVDVSKAISRGGAPVLKVTVTDTGVGIPAERLASIFDTFVQAEGSTTRRFGGSGLGLTISRSLAEMMGGAVRVQSTVGKGTSMTLVLPWIEVEKRDSDAADAGALPARPDEQAVRPQASILLIEDVDINRELFSEMLTELGHRFDLGEDGVQACELARQLEHDPEKWDLILMDLQMPVMDGLAATRAIRARGGRSATIPIIALTASAFEDEIRDCHAAGMNDHLAKPVGIEQLAKIINRWRAGLPVAQDSAATPHARSGSPARKYEARRGESRDRLARILDDLDSRTPEERASLVREARQIAHFLAGCAGMFGERELGDLASEVEHQLDRAAEQSPGSPAASAALESLIAALDAPRSQAADEPPRRRHA
jgi:PAS domain S-box-containing protein